jgi:glutaredoxin
MKYIVYVKHTTWEYLSLKFDIIDAIKEIRKDFNESSRAEYMIIEDDGRSQFPIVFLQGKDDYYKLIQSFEKEIKQKSKKIKKSIDTI